MFRTGADLRQMQLLFEGILQHLGEINAALFGDGVEIGWDCETFAHGFIAVFFGVGVHIEDQHADKAVRRFWHDL